MESEEMSRMDTGTCAARQRNQDVQSPYDWKPGQMNKKT